LPNVAEKAHTVAGEIWYDDCSTSGIGKMNRPTLAITSHDIERFGQRAQECRAEAELASALRVRPARLETALAYDRMAERGKRLLGLS
jgi:hypothetical protein